MPGGELGPLALDRRLEPGVEARVDVRVVLLDGLEQGTRPVRAVATAHRVVVHAEHVVAVHRGHLGHLGDDRAHAAVRVLVVLVLCHDGLLEPDGARAVAEGRADEDGDDERGDGEDDQPEAPAAVVGGVVCGLHDVLILVDEGLREGCGCVRSVEASVTVPSRGEDRRHASEAPFERVEVVEHPRQPHRSEDAEDRRQPQRPGRRLDG